MAALALATDPPEPELLDRKPNSKSEPLINYTMWKMVIGQAIYQVKKRGKTACLTNFLIFLFFIF